MAVMPHTAYQPFLSLLLQRTLDCVDRIAQVMREARNALWWHLGTLCLERTVGLNCMYNVLYYVDIVKLFWSLMYGALKFFFALFDTVILLNAELPFLALQ